MSRFRTGRLLAFCCALLLPGSFDANAQGFGLVHRFGTSGEPWGNLVRADDGFFYGTTSAGGDFGAGTAFRIDAAGVLVTLHSFGYTDGAEPRGALIQAGDGNFYGVTSLGGANNLGTVFRMDALGNVTTLHSFSGFTDGSAPQSALLEAVDGNFYGTTTDGGTFGVGTYFRMDASGTLTNLYSFQGLGGPAAPLIQGADGFFYGTTYLGSGGKGSVIRLDTLGNLATLHSFTGPDGANPAAALLQADDGLLYGTTAYGGMNGSGTVFRLDVFGGNFETLAEISSPNAALIQATDGDFYGTTFFSAYRMDESGAVEPLHSLTESEGSFISAPLVEGADGIFYGTARLGGENGYGTLFRVDSAGDFTTLHHFPGGDGMESRAPLIEASDGNFYGTTSSGGVLRRGSVFRVDRNGCVTILHSFSGLQGESPSALVQGTDGFFYGTTAGGGAGGFGTTFRINSAGGFTMLHEFDGIDGLGPGGPLILGSDGDFYGTTHGGGGFGYGSVFRMSPEGEIETLHGFDLGDEGYWPAGGLVQGADGFFYGTTSSGGSSDAGTVFRIDASGDFTSLHSFDFIDGFSPRGSMIQANDGDFYGATSTSIFRMDDSGDVTLFHKFTDDEGRSPNGIIQASDGNFYGTTTGSLPGGLLPDGSIFRMDPALGDVTTLHAFSGTDGATPDAGLLETSDGSLWGTTFLGGSPLFQGHGVLFRWSPSSLAVNAILPASGPAAGGTALQLFGGGFLTDAALTVNGLPATDVTIAGPTFLYGALPPLSPGTLNDVTVVIPGSAPSGASATLPGGYFADFLDVPQADIFHDDIESIFRAGITAGCGGGDYCPDSAVTRAQMAVFLLKAKHGAAYDPPGCAGVFEDVICPSLFADWIEQLAAEGITAGCGVDVYCPDAAVSRQQMAVFLLKAEHGSGYVPPPCTGIFTDVPCSSPFAVWIEQLVVEGITAGCGGVPPLYLYCPASPSTRGQMAVFLTRTFSLH